MVVEPVVGKSANLSREALRELPKAHLHVHLDGALRADTLRELLAEQQQPFPSIPGGVFSSFEAFMSTITATHRVLQRPMNLARVVGEIVEDNSDDGVVWLELAVWPGLFGTLRPAEFWVETILEAGHGAAARAGAGFGLIIAVNRAESPSSARHLMDLAAKYSDQGVVGVGLDGDEAANPAEPFAELFRAAAECGLRCVPHAGELRGPSSVWTAINRLHAVRIGHGIRAVEDSALLEELAGRAICLDVCPTSNHRLGVVDLGSPTHPQPTHPLRQLIEAGVACSLGADDPLLFGSSILDEYALAHERLGLSAPQLAQLAANSIAHSAAPAGIRAAAERGIRQWKGIDQSDRR